MKKQNAQKMKVICPLFLHLPPFPFYIPSNSLFLYVLSFFLFTGRCDVFKSGAREFRYRLSPIAQQIQQLILGHEDVHESSRSGLLSWQASGVSIHHCLEVRRRRDRQRREGGRLCREGGRRWVYCSRGSKSNGLPNIRLDVRECCF